MADYHLLLGVRGGEEEAGGVTMGTDANVAFYVSVLQVSFSQAHIHIVNIVIYKTQDTNYKIQDTSIIQSVSRVYRVGSLIG